MIISDERNGRNGAHLPADAGGSPLPADAGGSPLSADAGGSPLSADADRQFRITARRNRLLALWAGEKLGLTEAEADSYAKAVVQADFEGAGDEDVIRKLIGDLLKGGVETRDIEIREMLSRMADEARAQIDAPVRMAG